MLLLGKAWWIVPPCWAWGDLHSEESDEATDARSDEGGRPAVAVPLLRGALAAAFALRLPDAVALDLLLVRRPAGAALDRRGALVLLELVAELGGAFELEVLGGLEHFLFEELDD